VSEILRIVGLEKKFGDHSALQGINLSVWEGKTVAIIGPSGSGKSTLLRCVNRLERPTAGRIFFEGQEVDANTNLPALRARMGMVFQHFNLFSHMTVLGNLIEAPMQVRKLAREPAIEIARELLRRVGLSDKQDAYPAQLSGGQKQRVAIARCLAMEPRLLLLDEITSSLDPELVGDVLAVIRDLATRGMTMLAVTHEMGFAQEIADRVVFMDEGRILEEAPPAQMFARPSHPRLQKFLRAVLQRMPLELS
jgi:ABC-type polar amino acid transport system ATPase subunit